MSYWKAENHPGLGGWLVVEKECERTGRILAAMVTGTKDEQRSNALTMAASKRMLAALKRARKGFSADVRREIEEAIYQAENE